MNTNLIGAEFTSNYHAKGYALVRGMFGEEQIGADSFIAAIRPGSSDSPPGVTAPDY